MRAALLIVGKDLRQRLRDRSALLIALVVPFALAAILGLTLGNVSSGKVRFQFALVPLDRGQAASYFAGDVLAPLEQQGLARLRRAGSVAEARRLADRGTVAAAFVLPVGFSHAVAAGGPTRIGIIGNRDEPIGTLVARSIAQAYASQTDSIRVAVAAALRARAGRSGPPAAALARRAAALAAPITIADVSAKRKEVDAKTYYAAGMAVFFLFFTVQFGISSLLDERRDGTLARLLAAPISKTAILGGKALTSVVLGLVSMGVLVLASSLLLGAHWGNPLGIALLVLCGVLAATAVTALVVTLARTPEQAGYWQAIVALVLGMLGGSFFPLYQAGGWLGALSLASPHAWFLRGLRDLAGGAPASAALTPAAIILAFAGAAGALTLFRRNALLAR